MRGTRFGRSPAVLAAVAVLTAGLAACQGPPQPGATSGDGAASTAEHAPTSIPAPADQNAAGARPADPRPPTTTPSPALSTADVTVSLTSTVTGRPRPKPPAEMELNDRGDDVRELEARLVQLGRQDERWLDGYFGTTTQDAVSGFQERNDLWVLGYVDARTWKKVRAGTRTPTDEELHPARSEGANTPGALDARCLSGRVLCVDKSSKTLRWVVDGQVRAALDARFGCSATQTREGTFAVYSKQRDGYSNLYDSPMPFSLYFDGGQAVHYSADFNARGYDGCSHGCVNIRDWDGLERVFGQAEVGDKVVVYWS